MDKKLIAAQMEEVVASYDPASPRAAADSLRRVWLQFEPNKGMDGIKAELREMQETIGIPVPVLSEIGKGLGRYAQKNLYRVWIIMATNWHVYYWRSI